MRFKIRQNIIKHYITQGRYFSLSHKNETTAKWKQKIDEAMQLDFMNLNFSYTEINCWSNEWFKKLKLKLTYISQLRFIEFKKGLDNVYHFVMKLKRVIPLRLNNRGLQFTMQFRKIWIWIYTHNISDVTVVRGCSYTCDALWTQCFISLLIHMQCTRTDMRISHIHWTSYHTPKNSKKAWTTVWFTYLNISVSCTNMKYKKRVTYVDEQIRSIVFSFLHLQQN